MKQVVGRIREVEILKEVLASDQPELVAIYGRRRIGKTYLIEETAGSHIVFSISGLHRGNQKDQLENFINRLNKHYKNNLQLQQPSTWLQAFEMLEDYLNTKRRGKKKKIIFIDELPWIATRRSKFLMAFENFLNTYASHRPDIAVVICGSAASWMINKVVKNKGGLHNRITHRIKLLPFTLGEVELFLHSRGIKLSRYDIIQLYMVTGGVPFYLRAVKKGLSVAQIIDQLCFSSNGLLIQEFEELYTSLFEHSERHISVVKMLSQARKGYTRKEILKQSNLTSGGGLTRTLDELVESGFISKYLPYKQHTKQTLYRLTDFFSSFYMKYMHNSLSKEKETWLKKRRDQSWISWSGFTFESICLQHVSQIKDALGLAVIYTEESGWVSKQSDQGSQIDLLIDRDDRIIHICEIKFGRMLFTINKSYANNLRHKIESFRSETRTNKNLYLTMITTYGVVQNEYALELVQNELTMDALFGE